MLEEIDLPIFISHSATRKEKGVPAHLTRTPNRVKAFQTDINTVPLQREQIESVSR
jgi:hypothetical protein